MHNSVQQWVGLVVGTLGISNQSVLEVGSYDVNGSVRHLFTGDYWGVDPEIGPGVDEVGDGENLRQLDDSYPVVVSTEVLEHVERPWRIVGEMARVCAPGGHVILTARGYDERGCFPVHEYPRDYWRYSVGSFRVLLEDAGLEVLQVTADPEAPGVFGLARKPA